MIFFKNVTLQLYGRKKKGNKKIRIIIIVLFLHFRICVVSQSFNGKAIWKVDCFSPFFYFYFFFNPVRFFFFFFFKF